MSRASGVTDHQLRDLPVFQSSATFSPLEKLLIEYAARMTQTPVEVGDELFASLRQNLIDAQLVKLTAAIPWANYRARFDHAMGVEFGGFRKAQFVPCLNGRASCNPSEEHRHDIRAISCAR